MERLLNGQHSSLFVQRENEDENSFNQVGVDEALEVLLGLLLLQVDDGDLTIRNGLRLLLAGAGIRITVGNVGEWNLR